LKSDEEEEEREEGDFFSEVSGETSPSPGTFFSIVTELVDTIYTDVDHDHQKLYYIWY